MVRYRIEKILRITQKFLAVKFQSQKQLNIHCNLNGINNSVFLQHLNFVWWKAKQWSAGKSKIFVCGTCICTCSIVHKCTCQREWLECLHLCEISVFMNTVPSDFESVFGVLCLKRHQLKASLNHTHCTVTQKSSPGFFRGNLSAIYSAFNVVSSLHYLTWFLLLFYLLQKPL